MQDSRLPGFLFPLLFAVLWSSTYATAQVGLLYITPAYFVALRLALATLAMFALVFLIRGEKLPRGITLLHLLVGGALVHGLTQVPAHMALISVKAAPLALVHAFHPVLTAALSVFLLNDKFSPRQWCGLALGFIGVALAFPFATTSWSVIGLVALSLAGLTGGTLYLKRFAQDVSAYQSTAIQIFGGTLAAALAMALVETPDVTWSVPLVLSFAWNIFAVSVIGMSIYTLMIARGQAARAASAFFIVPGVAALVGWALMGQSLTLIALAGLAIASFGVWLVWWRQGESVPPAT